ncbi:MAG: hypothetical protein CM1200mP2_07710 [Planctomycetaceae bacterium]|nr:MAG: hypothetical protein CM1200mP2_07710 [Planctomycetaceae bacterium]
MEEPAGSPFVPSAIVVGKRYYLVTDSGIATCLDTETGKQVWQKRFGGGFTASPVAAGDRIYWVNESGVTLVIRGEVTVTRNWPGTRSVRVSSRLRRSLRIDSF